MIEIDPAAVPEPTATGLLAERPLAHLLAYAEAHAMSGTFELADDPREYALLVLDQGKLARVWTSEPVSYLGHVLYEGGALTDAQLGQSLAEIARTKALHGQTLLGAGIIDVNQLATALRQQRLRKLQHVFGFPPSARFSFYADVDLVGARPHDVEPADLIPPIWRGIMAHPSPEHVQTAVAAVAGRPMRLSVPFDTDTLRKADRDALESLRHWPASAATLATRPGQDSRSADLLVYFLIVTRRGEVAEVAPASAPTPEPVSVRSHAVPQSVRNPSGSSYPAAPSSTRSWAPPSSSSTALTDGPPSSLRGVPQSGPQSVRAMPPRSVTPPPMSRPSAAPPAEEKDNPDALYALAQAEMHFSLREMQDAVRFVREALTLQPKMPGAVVLFAALEASTIRDGDKTKLGDIEKRLNAVITRNPGVRRGKYYRAQVRKKLGDVLGVLDDLRDALAADPDDADVQRALRVAEQPSPASSKPASLFDRLRGR